MKYKHLIILFLLGILADVFAEFLKIIQFEFSKSFLLVTTSVEAIAVVLFIVKMISDEKTEFLNR